MSDWLELPFDDGDPDDVEAVPAPAAPLSVSELSLQLKAAIERGFSRLTVEGEISNFRRWSSGHLYFTLKDDQSQIRAVMFRTSARQLTCEPEDGMHVVVRGRVSVYEVKGDYQIICDAIEPHGLGALQAAFDALKKRLGAEGLFAPERKRPLPVLPRRIGVVTSLNGAAVRDILHVLTSRHPTARVLVRPARVQGDGAAADLVRALRAVAAQPDIDVILIGRGGGSAEDLQAFNDEGLARAIADCPVPVISGVGHETDFTIADFVADLRAATPSNAAELVVDRADNFVTRIERAEARLGRAMHARVERAGRAADRLDMRLRAWPTTVLMRQRDVEESHLRLRQAALGRVGQVGQRFDQLRRRLERRDIRRVAADVRTRLVAAEGRLRAAAEARRSDARSRAGELAARLNALSPLAVLGRGYAVCWNEARTGIIRSAEQVSAGARVRVTLADGELGCRVEDAISPDRQDA